MCVWKKKVGFDDEKKRGVVFFFRAEGGKRDLVRSRGLGEVYRRRCWGGMAMINHFHSVKKHMLDDKAFGCFRHKNLDPRSPYLQGFSDDCVIPTSRWTEVHQPEIDASDGLKTLLGSDEVGPCVVQDPKHRGVYIFSHFEYDSATLKQEYDRDVEAGTPINIPTNYYPGDDPSQEPTNRWRSHAHLFYGNWLNSIYQTTPFEMDEIGA